MKRRLIWTMLFSLCLVLVVTVLPVKADTAPLYNSVKLEMDEKTGVLRVYGNGTIDQVFWDGKQMLYDNPYRKITTTLIVEEGITCLGTYAFQQFVNLTSVQLPTTLTEIGHGAFASCSSLESIHIPDSVTTIGTNAFSGCSQLKEVTLPSALTELGNRAFYGCTRLQNIQLPDSLTVFYADTFANCRYYLKEIRLGPNVSKIELNGLSDLAAIHISQDNPYYMSDRGVVYTKDGKTLLLLPNAFTGNYTVLPGTETIGAGACESTKISKIYLPNTLTRIETKAFYGTTLTAVTLPRSLAYIGTDAFDVSALTAIHVNPDNPYYMSDQGVVYSKNGETLLLLPSGFTGEYSILPGTTTIGAQACKSIHVSKLNIPNSVTTIEAKAFYEARIASITLPDSLLYIRESAFRYATLTSITIPGSVRCIEKFAFADNTSLTTLNISDGVQEIGFYAFAKAPITEVRIPDSVTDIQAEAFAHCKQLTTITFTGKAPELSADAFKNVVATVYHPDGSSWNPTMRIKFGKNLTWVAASSTTPTTAPTVPTEPAEEKDINLVRILAAVVIVLAVGTGIILSVPKKKK